MLRRHSPFLLALTALTTLFLSGCGQLKPETQPETSQVSVDRIDGTYYYGTRRLRFSAAAISVLDSAIATVRDRIDSNAVWACANQNHRRWKVENSGQNITTTERFRTWNRMVQRAFVNDPTIALVIKPYVEYSDMMGRAVVAGDVRPQVASTSGITETYELQGTFIIELNTVQLSNPTSQDVDRWAGVIAHEMLHQMGYSHHDNSYDDDMFITVFGDCLQNNGRYISRSQQGLSLDGRPFPKA